MNRVKYSSKVMSAITKALKDEDIHYELDEKLGELSFLLHGCKNIKRFHMVLHFCGNNIVIQVNFPVFIDISDDVQTFNMLKFIQMANCEFAVKSNGHYSPRVDSIDIGALSLCIRTGGLVYKNTLLDVDHKKAYSLLYMTKKILNYIILSFFDGVYQIAYNNASAEKAIMLSNIYKEYQKADDKEIEATDERWYFTEEEFIDYDDPEEYDQKDKSVKEIKKIIKEEEECERETKLLDCKIREELLNVFTSEI